MGGTIGWEVRSVKGIAWACAVLVLPLPALAADAEKGEAHEKHWSYQGALSPAHWSEVAPTCGIGKHQSPVALHVQAAKSGGAAPALAFSYGRVLAEETDNGHTIQVNVPTGNFITLGETRYELQQFHFHTPSEHTIDGKPAPMEVHFVHRGPDGKLAVVGVLLRKEGAESRYASLLSSLPKAGTIKTVEVDLPALLPKDPAHFVYSGSLTTPPCSEDVQWLVMLAPQDVTPAEVETFRARYPKNARPVQPLQGRTVQLAR